MMTTLKALEDPVPIIIPKKKTHLNIGMTSSSALQTLAVMSAIAHPFDFMGAMARGQAYDEAVESQKKIAEGLVTKHDPAKLRKAQAKRERKALRKKN